MRTELVAEAAENRTQNLAVDIKLPICLGGSVLNALFHALVRVINVLLCNLLQPTEAIAYACVELTESLIGTRAQLTQTDFDAVVDLVDGALDNAKLTERRLNFVKSDVNLASNRSSRVLRDPPQNTD